MMRLPQFAKWERELLKQKHTLEVYRNMSREQWLCTLGIQGCDMHKRSGYYQPFWRDPRRWLY